MLLIIAMNVGAMAFAVFGNMLPSGLQMTAQFPKVFSVMTGGLLAAVCRRLPASLRFEAITLGHVVLGLDTACLDGARAHEQVHVRQYERWGPLFVPLYLASSGWQWLRGGCPYRDNHFERDAYALAPVCHLPAAANDRAMVE